MAIRNKLRPSAQTKDGLSLTIRIADGQTLIGQITDLSRETIRAEVIAKGRGIPMGSEANLTLRTPAVRHTITMSAQCTSRVDSDSKRIYDFCFLDSSELDSQLGGQLCQLFNRRGAARLPMESAPAAVCAFDGGSEGKLSKAAMIDLSSSGAGFVVSGSVEQHLATTETVAFRFRLPGEAEILQLLAAVRRRSLHSDGIFYGVEFDSIRTPDFERIHGQIVAFLREREIQLVASFQD